MDAYGLTLIFYNMSLLPVIFFSAIFFILALMSLFAEKGMEEKEPVHDELELLPFVSVQVPTFNDPVAVRCIQKCLEFDYPRERYEIIIADDSTNPETQLLLSRLAEENPGFVKYIHRNCREGFKAGALRNAMPATRGELFAIFDADWLPRKDFLKRIIEPFKDPKVAIVQTRQGFYNHQTNLITRYAAYTMMLYYSIIMPINNMLNCVFFCGTAGAIRRKAFEEVGGWNEESLTEDSDLSVRLLSKGYKSVYLPIETPSEVPDTLENFVKQQMRWCYGNTRVFFDHAGKILFRKGLKLHQRIMILFVTLSNSSTLVVMLMTFFGLLGWVLGEPKLITVADFLSLSSKLLFTGGFTMAGIITLFKRKHLDELGYFVLGVFTMGIIIAFSNAISFTRALLNKRPHWSCTPKAANLEVLGR